MAFVARNGLPDQFVASGNRFEWLKNSYGLKLRCGHLSAFLNALI
jgi:hypothetical protein